MFVIKLRGLPWSCTTEDIVKFMEGVLISCRVDDTSKSAVYLMTNSDGRPSGEAFIQVDTEVDVEAACNKNNQLMGQRYIEGKMNFGDF
jgi:heterogeneous nuclear ribonucleoprotein F/H